jgi:predicted homoserine dehydrogenase-like protein
VDHHQYFPAGDRKVETCVIGTGSFGRSYLAQARRVPRMSARVAIDVDAQTAARVLTDVGIEARRVRVCSTAAEARSAWAAGDHIAASDLAVVLDLPIEVVVEATGHPEAAVRHAVLAIESGRHVVMVSKEADVVVGAGLAARAADKGLVVTPVDGDQPSLLIGLVSWAEVLGFDIIAAGKSSECDFVFDAASGRLEHNGVIVEAPQLRSLWKLGTGNVAELVAARAKAASALPQRVVADRCELAIVANATGLDADQPLLHAPIARSIEIADVLALQGNGGLLSGPRKIDVFNALRAPDEASFAGGVFVLISCSGDRSSWDLLAGKGHVVSRDGSTAMAYLPRHWLGVEAATSVLDAALNRRSTGAKVPRPHLDLIARATKALPAGTVLTMGGHYHTIDGVEGELQRGAPLGDNAPVPFYLAANRKLDRPVAAGAPIVLGDIEIEGGSMLLAERKCQDARFFGSKA